MTEKDQLQQRVQQAFARQPLDTETRDQLRRARQHALDAEPRVAAPAWLPAAAVAGLMLALSAVMLVSLRDATELPPLTDDELAVLTSEDELELFEELEFYIWLDGEDNV